MNFRYQKSFFQNFTISANKKHIKDARFHFLYKTDDFCYTKKFRETCDMISGGKSGSGSKSLEAKMRKYEFQVAKIIFFKILDLGI